MKRNPELEPLTDAVLQRRGEELGDMLNGLPIDHQIDVVAYEVRFTPQLLHNSELRAWIKENAHAVKEWSDRGHKAKGAR